MEPLTLPDTDSASSVPTLKEPELNLLLPREAEEAWHPGRPAVVRSVIFHVVTIGVLLMVKTGPVEQRPPERYFVRHVTPLYTPPELTQKEPNKGPVKKDLALETIAPRPSLKAPAPAAAPKQTSAAKALPMPAPTEQAPPKAIATIEPPKIEAPPQALQPAQIAGVPQLPPPPGSGTPKLMFEDVPQRQAPTGKPTGLVPVPSASVQDVVKEMTRGGTPGAASGGEISLDQGGSGPGLNLPASKGQAQGGIKLLSDTNGVDFRPYLIQVMAAIRRNWFAVYPEAAKTGMRGEVILQFRVAKQGLVAKVVYNGQSNSRALNEAAVSAISASNPFPPLPAEYKGDHVDLQMRFMYNMPR
jgi:TonB family protein